MLLGKDERLLRTLLRDTERELQEVKRDNVHLKEQLADLKNPPEGCKPGDWCQGCQWSSIVGPWNWEAQPRRICLYGACEKREPVSPISFTGCV